VKSVVTEKLLTLRLALNQHFRCRWLLVLALPFIYVIHPKESRKINEVPDGGIIYGRPSIHVSPLLGYPLHIVVSIAVHTRLVYIAELVTTLMLDSGLIPMKVSQPLRCLVPSAHGVIRHGRLLTGLRTVWGWEEGRPRELRCDGHSFGLVYPLGLGFWFVCCLIGDKGHDMWLAL
jgi:hypothetical protein